MNTGDLGLQGQTVLQTSKIWGFLVDMVTFEPFLNNPSNRFRMNLKIGALDLDHQDQVRP